MNALDKVIGYINPKAGFERLHNRARMKVMADQVRRYEGAATGRRHASWAMNSNPSVNQLINRDLKNLVSRSRELFINNPYAKKAPYTIANNIVGTGIIPTPVIRKKDSDGKLTAVTNENLLKDFKDAWAEWADKSSCDYNGDFNFYGLQHLAVRTKVISGEILAIRKKVRSEVNRFGLQIQLIEADYIDTTKNNDKDSDGGYTLYGVKFDKDFKKSGYYIFDRHPSEASAVSKLVPIAEVIHLYDVERTGQTRGVPDSAATLLKQRDLDDYEDAELLAKKGSACYAGFVTNTAPEAAANQSEQIENIEPGTITYLNPGETMTFPTPPQNPGFGEFAKSQHRAIATGYLMSYEAFSGDLSNVNFSSGRMGWIEFNRQIEYWQYLMFIPKFCDRAFEWFIDAYKVAASVPEGTAISATWTAPKRQMIDPAKEVAGMRTETRAGFKSWSEVVRENGYNPDEVLKQMQEDQEKFEKAGLQPDYTPYFEKQALIQQTQANAVPKAK